jgi:hypothetical protein
MSQFLRSAKQQYLRSAKHQRLRSPPAVPPLTCILFKTAIFKKTIAPGGGGLQAMIDTMRANIDMICAAMSWFGTNGEPTYYYDFDAHPAFAIGNGVIGGAAAAAAAGVVTGGLSGYAMEQGDELTPISNPIVTWCWITSCMIFPFEFTSGMLPYSLADEPTVVMGFGWNGNAWLPIPASVFVCRNPGSTGPGHIYLPSASLINQKWVEGGSHYDPQWIWPNWDDYGTAPGYQGDYQLISEPPTNVPPNDVDGAPPAGAVTFATPISDDLGQFDIPIAGDLSPFPPNFPGNTAIAHFYGEQFTLSWGPPDYSGGAGGPGGIPPDQGAGGGDGGAGD